MKRIICIFSAVIIFVISNWFFSKAFAQVLINDRLSLIETETKFDPTPVEGGAAGMFTITATFKNASEDNLTELAFKVIQLTGGNLLLNADGRVGGIGSTLTVPFAGDYSDGVLSPGENFKVDFIIGLASPNQFTFLVDVLGAVVVLVDITADTGQQVFGPVTHWQTLDGDLIVEHLAGLNGPLGDLLEFWSSPAVSNGKWQYVNVSENTSHQIISTQLTSWQVPDGVGIAEHLASQSPMGDLLVFFRSSAALGGKWQVVNVSQKTNQQIGGPVTSWQTSDGEFIVEHLAGRSPTGDLLEFFWSPRADWQVVNVSADTGHQIIATQLTSWQVQDGAGIAEHLAGQSPTGDLLVFFRSSAAQGENWHVVNVSQITSQQIGGPVTSWQTPDGEFIVEHLASRSPAGDLLVFFWSPRADWQVVNVSQIAGGGPVSGTPAVYQVFDGLENVEILSVRDISGSLRLYSWKPSHDWQINDPSETAAFVLLNDPTAWLTRALSGLDVDENFGFVSADGHLKRGRKPRPKAVLGPTDLNARYTDVDNGNGTLTWKDNSSNEDDFYLEFSKNGTSWIQSPSNPLMANTTSTDFHFPILEGETAYFRIRAHRQSDDFFSDISNVATASRLPRPTRPSDFACEFRLASSGQMGNITITWKDNSNDEDEFEIIVREIIGNTLNEDTRRVFNVPANTTTFTDVDLPLGKTFDYTVSSHRLSDGTFGINGTTCTTSGEFPQTVTLGRQTVGVGAVFVYGGKWPVPGEKNGLLKKVFLARGFGPLLEVRFQKPGHDISLECDNPNAFVQLIAGGTLSGQDLVALFGSATPRLPAEFRACAIFNPPVPDEKDVPLFINILITYTAP